MTTTKTLSKIQFMTQSQYSSATKSQNNLYMVEIQPSVDIFPNYNAGISLSANTTYTVGTSPISASAGWFRIGFGATSWHGQSPQLVITINGEAFYSSYFCSYTMIYLTTGDTFACNSTQSNVYANFFPVLTS